MEEEVIIMGKEEFEAWNELVIAAVRLLRLLEKEKRGRYERAR